MDDLGYINHLLEKAILTALRAHRGQVDRVGRAYVLHPLRVANRCKTDEERIVAILHDVIEQGGMTAEQLLAEGFPSYLVEAVLAITRQPGEGCDDFMVRILRNPIGRQVKKHDLEDHIDLMQLRPLTPDFIDTYNEYLIYYAKFE